MNNKPRFISRFVSLISIAVLIMLSVMTVSSSASLDELVAVVEGERNYYCAQQITALGNQVIPEYQNFLNQQTLDPRNNSDRLEAILPYYRYVIAVLDEGFEQWSVRDFNGETVNSSSDEFQHCKYLHDYYVTMADSMLHSFYISSTGSKTSFKVVDGLKAINNEMGGLSDRFHQAFPAMFNKFDNAFPCYVNSCIGR